MDVNSTLTFYVDDEYDATNQKNVVGNRSIFNNAKGVHQNFDSDILCDSMKETIAKVATIMDDSYLKDTNCIVDEISFTLSVNAGGAVSILSAISANASASSGITVKLKRRANE